MADQPRLAPLDPSDWSDDTRVLLESGAFVGNDQVLNIFATLAHHPKLLRRWLVFGAHVLAKSTLEPRTREILILRTGWRCGSQYEWGQHVVIGRAVGLTDDEIARIATGPSASDWSDADRSLVVAADELFDYRTLSDSTYTALAAVLTTEQVLDLIFTVGQYQLVATALNTLRVQRDDGVTGVPFPETPHAPVP